MNRLIFFALFCCAIVPTVPASRAASPGPAQPGPEITLFVIAKLATIVRTFHLDPAGQADLALDDKPHGLRARLTLKNDICTLVYTSENVSMLAPAR